MSYTNHRATLLFWLRYQKENKKGLVPIYCRITFDNKQWNFSSGAFIRPHQWDGVNKRALPGTEGYLVINSVLEGTQRKFEQAVFELNSFNIELSLDKIKYLYNGGKITYFTEAIVVPKLRELLREFIQYKSNLISENCLEKYEQYHKRIGEFINAKYMQKDIELDKVKLKFMDELYLHCRTKLNYSFASTNKLLAHLKSALNFAILHEYISTNYVASYRCAKYGSRKEVIFLNSEQLNKLYHLQLKSDKLERVKNLFLFQCFTGLAYIDLYTLTLANIKHENNKFWIIKERQKSGVTSNIPLTEDALMIFNKISFLPIENLSSFEVDKTEKIINCISNQKYNKYLKELGKSANLDLTLTTHVARKTFATITLNNGNVSIESVAKMLGHANTKITQSTYTRVLNTRIETEMKDFRFIDAVKLVNT